jgi:hypothetical protein
MKGTKKQGSEKTEWARPTKTEALLAVVAAASLLLSVVSLYVDNTQFQTIHSLNERNTELNEEIHNLTDRIYGIEHPEPTIEVLSIDDIEVGLTSSYVLNDGRVTLDYDGVLSTVVEVLIATRHDGKLVVQKNVGMQYGNFSEYNLHFQGYVEMKENLTVAVGQTTEVIHIDLPFNITFSFTNSPILQHSTIEIATFRFYLEFHDLQRLTLEYRELHTAKIFWNNQTVLT